MAGTLKVDSINADSNLALKIANTAVAFIDATGLRPVAGNLNLDATATSKFYLPSANTVAIQTAGVTAVTIDSSQNTTLAGTLTTTGITNSGVATATRFNPTGSSVTGNGMYLPAANSLGLSTNGTNAVYIDSSQRVGIGVSSPAKPLSVYGGDGYIQMLNASTGTATGDGSFIGVEGGTTALRIVNQENDAISFSTNGLANERMRIDSSGNAIVGANTVYSGTASNFTATTGVDIGSSSTATSKQLQFIRNGSTGTAGNIYATAGNFSNYCGIEFVIDNVGGGSQAGYLKFNTTSGATSAERMRIQSGGNVLIGCTTNPTASVSGKEINSSYYQSSCGTTTTSFIHFYFTNGNGNIGTITTSGSTTTYGSPSDYRLKENIAPMTGALATVSQLNPVTYKWKVDGSDGQGFIAHELQAVVPDCVSGEKDAVNENGDIKPQNIDTSFLVATLTAAIQELKAINDTQAATIAALTARMVAVESK